MESKNGFSFLKWNPESTRFFETTCPTKNTLNGAIPRSPLHVSHSGKLR